jgi:hypothetical protein
VEPESTPVDVFSCSPEGSTPEVIIHWYGSTPPLAERVASYETLLVPGARLDVVIFNDWGGTIVTLAVM